MSHSAEVAHHHKSDSRGVEAETLEKGLMHILPGGGSRSLWVLGELVTYKIPSHKTGGAYALFEVASLPSTGPPPHIHHREDESFYILEGEYKFLIGRESLRVGVGTLIYVPKGTLHAHRSVGAGLDRMLVSQTPGGLYERFFEEVGKPMDGDRGALVFEDQPSVERIVEAAATYGIEIPTPMAE